jgi:hypothetical protein
MSLRQSSANSRLQSERTSTSARRLRFDDVEVTSPRPDQVSCRVTLTAQDDRVFVGEGSSVVLGTAQMNAAARATVHAVQAFADTKVTLESCNKTHLGGRDVVLVVLSVSADPPQELIGAVMVRGDESKAAALAVLDATNRWLETRVRDLVALV